MFNNDEKSYFAILSHGRLAKPLPNLFHYVCYCFAALDAANEVFRKHESVPVRVTACSVPKNHPNYVDSQSHKKNLFDFALVRLK